MGMTYLHAVASLDGYIMILISGIVLQMGPRRRPSPEAKRGDDRRGQTDYSMNPSLDGFISGPDGNSTGRPQTKSYIASTTSGTCALGGFGRRLYETMVYWETADEIRGDRLHA